MMMGVSNVSSRMRITALLGATMLAGVPAFAQTAPAPAQLDTPTPTVATPAKPDQSTVADPGVPQDTASSTDGDIVVTGFRQSYANAIASKRSQVGITDGISSD